MRYCLIKKVVSKMFGKLKNLFGGDSGIEVTAPVAGKVVALEDVPDPTFAQGILGPGIAIEPSEGRIVAPADGTVDVMFETGHAVSMTTADGAELDAERECKRYDAAIKAAGGIDLQLLGMGLNGHIGFNEPDEYFSKGTHCVNLTESTIEANKRFFASADDVPRQAYTMGVQTIMLARRIVLVVSGENKAETVREAFFGPVTPQVPASILQLHTDVSIVADEAALSKCGDLL